MNRIAVCELVALLEKLPAGYAVGYGYYGSSPPIFDKNGEYAGFINLDDKGIYLFKGGDDDSQTNDS